MHNILLRIAKSQQTCLRQTQLIVHLLLLLFKSGSESVLKNHKNLRLLWGVQANLIWGYFSSNVP